MQSYTQPGCPYKGYFETYCVDCDNEICKQQFRKIDEYDSQHKRILTDCAEFRKIYSLLKGN